MLRNKSSNKGLRLQTEHVRSIELIFQIALVIHKNNAFEICNY